MLNFLDIKKENRNIILVNVWMLFFAFAAYLFFILLKQDGYNVENFKKAYTYFYILQFVIFSVTVPLWQGEGECSLKASIKDIAGIFIFVVSSLPMVFSILIAGRVSQAGLIPAVLLQSAWGMALIGLKRFLCSIKIDNPGIGLFMTIFTFAIIIGLTAAAYIYTAYAQTVITAVYDKDIPLIFFINPMLALLGQLYIPGAGGSQLGHTPYILCIGFWLAFYCLLTLLEAFISKRKGAYIGEQ